MMTEKSRKSGQMMDLVLVRYEAEDHEAAAVIRPLPSNVVPSSQFLKQTRLQLLRLSATDEAAGSRRAA